MPDLITILGPTATGKTLLAAHLAHHLKGEIISADSRQVYKGLDIGTGKDLKDYEVDGNPIPYHLIDIAEVTNEYNLFQYQQDFLTAFQVIKNGNVLPILCGGTGLYLDAILKGYHLKKAPFDEELRGNLADLPDEVLVKMLSGLRRLHNITDVEDRDRLIRAIEIARFEAEHPDVVFPKLSSINFGIRFEREEIKKRITHRLKIRLQSGMLDEVQGLLKSGISSERLFKLGLEYRWVSQYLLNQVNYNDMFQKLNAAIHAFAKRQMTWFRKMEREGINIHWLDGNLLLEDKTSFIKSHIEKSLK